MQIAENFRRSTYSAGWTSKWALCASARCPRPQSSEPGLSLPRPLRLTHFVFVMHCSGLMAQEDLNTLGFSEETKVVLAKPANEDDEGECSLCPCPSLLPVCPGLPLSRPSLPSHADKEIIAGLSSAKKGGKGLLFGLGGSGTGKRGGGH
jgi:hypothetical protein